MIFWCHKRHLTLFLFTLELFHSEGLKCYNCITEQMCNIHKLEEDCPTFCTSHRLKDLGINILKKGCETTGLSKSEFEKVCDELRSNESLVIEHCYACDTDLCNASPRHERILSPFLLAMWLLANRLRSL